MSTEEDASQISSKFPTPVLEDGPPTTKKRKIAVRACDFCRRKKIKCDAPGEAEGGKCTTCMAHGCDCTFVENAKKRGTPKGYVDYLERRVDRLEDVLRRFLPSFDVEKHIGRRASQVSWVEDREAHATPERVGVSSPSTGVPPTQAQGIAQTDSYASALSNPEPPEEESARSRRPEDALVDHLSQLQLGNEPFYGQASPVDLMIHARNVKSWSTGQHNIPKTKDPRPRPRPQSEHPGSLTSAMGLSIDRLKFPPQGLLDNLVSLYFRFFHPFFPTLHRPTFEGQLRQELHKTDVSFARQVLLVCAVGSRWSGDPRVCETPELHLPSGNGTEWRVAGWRYFTQVFDFPLPLNHTIHLLDLQNIVLYGFCGMMTRAPASPWLWAGTGVRCAMHMGAHRQKTYAPGHSLLNEMWKRTFWCLVNLDRLTSVSLGRPPAINDEDVDVALPLEVDDNRLVDPLSRDPAGDEPSQMQFFNNWTKLLRIAANAMKSIYGTGISKARTSSTGEEREADIVSQLDNALNDWLDKVPNHLRWNPTIANPIFSEQSANLNIHYHHVQILIHRPFLPGTDNKISSLSYSSLAICTNAARSISHILEAYLKRVLASEGSSDLSQTICLMPTNTGAVYLAGVVLLIAIWRSKMTGENVGTTSLANDMQKIMEYLSYAQKRYYFVTTVSDTLNELASAGGLPVNPTNGVGSAKPSLKRNRNGGGLSLPKQGLENDQPNYSSMGEASLQWTPPLWQSVDTTVPTVAPSTLPDSLPDPVDNGHLATAAMDTDFGELLSSVLNGSQLFQMRPQAPWLDPLSQSTTSSLMFGISETSAYPLGPGNTATFDSAMQQQTVKVDDFPGDHPLPARVQWDDAFYSATTSSAPVRHSNGGIRGVNSAGGEFGQALTGNSTWHTEGVAFAPSNGLVPEGSHPPPPNPLGNAPSLDWTSWVSDSWEIPSMDSLAPTSPDFPAKDYSAS